MGRIGSTARQLLIDLKEVGSKYTGIDAVIDAARKLEEAKTEEPFPVKDEQKLISIAEYSVYVYGVEYMLLLAHKELRKEGYDLNLVNECFRRAQEYAGKVHMARQTVRRIAKIKATTQYIEKMVLN